MLISSFLTYLQHEKRYSPHTLVAYETDLRQFEQYIQLNFELTPITCKAPQIRSFMVALMDDQISANAINRKISSLRSFYKYLQRESILAVNPMLLIRAPKVPKRLPVFVEEHKLDQLLDSQTIFTEEFASKRDKLVFRVAFWYWNSF